MKSYKLYLKIFIPIIIIMIFSFLNMHNALFISNDFVNHLTKQIIWYLVSLIIIIIIYKLNLSKVLKYNFFYYVISCFLLLVVLIVGRRINGARAWFKIGIFAFQPSELMKLSLTLYLIDIIVKEKNNSIKDEIRIIFKTTIITLIPSILVFLEPDTGAIIFYFLTAMVLLFTKINKWWFLLFITVITLLIFSFYLLFNYNQNILINIIGTSFFYRIERLLTFTNNNSYQLNNALIAIGSANVFGSGINKVSLYIPEAATDFVFAFNISNFGIISGLIVLICYFVLDIIFIKLIFNTKNKKIKLLICSFISMFIFQQIINIGMNLGLVPIIGIPLPFLSYGGTTIIIYILFISIILNLKKQELKKFY